MGASSRFEFSSDKHLEMCVWRVKWQPGDCLKVVKVVWSVHAVHTEARNCPPQSAWWEQGRTSSVSLETGRFKQVGSKLWGDTAGRR